MRRRDKPVREFARTKHRRKDVPRLPAGSSASAPPRTLPCCTQPRTNAWQEAFMDRKPEDKTKPEKNVLESKKKFIEKPGDEKLKHMGDKPAKVSIQAGPEVKAE